jgi:RNA 2',3'-cyclic 3'-phosphodiesterase
MAIIPHMTRNAITGKTLTIVSPMVFFFTSMDLCMRNKNIKPQSGCMDRGLMHIRTFISIHVPLNERLSDLLTALKATGNVRTVPIDQLHLTLRFIGDVDEQKLDSINSCIVRAASNFHGGTIRLEGIGTFPGIEKPRVIWIGVCTDVDLKAISEMLGSELDSERIQYDTKPFKPHMTIGRLDRIDDATSDILSRYAHSEFHTFECHSIELMKSDIRSSGAVHSMISSVPLHY